MGSLLKKSESVHIKKIRLKIWRLRDERGGTPVPEDKIHPASTILAEIDMNTISFFSSLRFVEGQSVVIEFQIPRKFSINAEVEYCRRYTMKSRIISNNKLPFRGRASLHLARPEQKNLLRQFLRSINHPGTQTPRPDFEPEQKAS